MCAGGVRKVARLPHHGQRVGRQTESKTSAFSGCPQGSKNASPGPDLAEGQKGAAQQQLALAHASSGIAAGQAAGDAHLEHALTSRVRCGLCSGPVAAALVLSCGERSQCACSGGIRAGVRACDPSNHAPPVLTSPLAPPVRAGHHFCGACLCSWLGDRVCCPACSMGLRAVPVRCLALDSVVNLLLSRLTPKEQQEHAARKQDGSTAADRVSGEPVLPPVPQPQPCGPPPVFQPSRVASPLCPRLPTRPNQVPCR